MAISKELLDILACPQCKGDVHLTSGGRARLQRLQAAIPIKDDIPIMLIEEAERL
jgi:uncharacterized protein YbaR (Trm112 family)